jgi:hypothetical protein
MAKTGQVSTRKSKKSREVKFSPKLEWCYEGDSPKWRQPPLTAIWQEPKSVVKSSACYFKLLNHCVQNIFQLTPAARLEQLIKYLERRKTKRDEDLVKRLRALIKALENIDEEWQADGTAADIAYHVDLYVEMMLPRYLNAMLHQLNVEAFFMCTPFKDAPGLKEPMRVAAGLPKKMSKAVDDLIMQVHESLIAVPRKERNQIRPGGKSPKLAKKANELWDWYEKLHPIWKDAKAIYKQNPSSATKAAIVKKYQSIFSGEASKAFYRQRDGLPTELVEELTSVDQYESSPEYLAYKHAAFMSGFGVNEYSVKQIKRVVAEYKNRVRESGFGDILQKRSRDVQK